MQIQVKSVCSRISTSKESVIQQINIVKILDKLRETRAVHCEDSVIKDLLKEQNGF